MAGAMVIARSSSTTLAARCPVPLFCAPFFLQPAFLPSSPGSRSNHSLRSYHTNVESRPIIHLRSYHRVVHPSRPRFSAALAPFSSLGFTNPTESLLPEVCIINKCRSFRYYIFRIHLYLCVFVILLRLLEETCW